jgi:hypothetical protein
MKQEIKSLNIRLGSHADSNVFALAVRVFSRTFSACSFALAGFESGVNFPPTYWKSSHRSMILGIRNL